MFNLYHLFPKLHREISNLQTQIDDLEDNHNPYKQSLTLEELKTLLELKEQLQNLQKTVLEKQQATQELSNGLTIVKTAYYKDRDKSNNFMVKTEWQEYTLNNGLIIRIENVYCLVDRDSLETLILTIGDSVYSISKADIAGKYNFSGIVANYEYYQLSFWETLVESIYQYKD